jgi:thiol-disulfide isomerase/thioredoxin
MDIVGSAPLIIARARGGVLGLDLVAAGNGSDMTSHWLTPRGPMPPGLHATAGGLPVEGELPSLDGATGWLNTPPLTAAGLRGSVVLASFWTYTCINWLRQLPYLRAWAQKYAADGLVVLGVHTPEFPFEHDPGNVSQAVADMNVTYPVVTDNKYAIWEAFGNHYWPALYFADAEGQIRHHRFGEGDYRQSEMVIQQLLTEAGAVGARRDLTEPEASGVEAPADWDTLGSPENYTGYARTVGFASPGGVVPGKKHAYAAPAELLLNDWALSGDWTMEAQGAILGSGGGQVTCRFRARDVHLVMGPAQTGGAAVPFRVLLDGQPPGGSHGTDVAASGAGTAAQQRLYQLIRQDGRITDRTIEITFAEPGVQVCAFTFG